MARSDPAAGPSAGGLGPGPITPWRSIRRARFRRHRSFSWIVGPLALLVAFAGIGWLVVRTQDEAADDAGRNEGRAVREARRQLSLGDEESGLPPFAAPAAPTLPTGSIGLEATKLDLAVRRLGRDRYEVDAGDLRWVMAGDPETELDDEDAGGGVVVRSRAWATSEDDRATEVRVVDVVGPIDPSAWSTMVLDGVRDQFADGSRPARLLGRPAFEVAAPYDRGGRRWTTRTLVAAFEGKLVVVSVTAAGDDPTAGQEAFLQLVSSFSPS